VREATVQRQILAYFSAMGIPALRINSGRLWAGRRRFLKFGDEGFPDVLAWPGKGITLAIEVKCPGEVMTPAQVEWARRLQKKGVRHLVARSVDEVVWTIKQIREAA
jgi:hypothetical protein